MLGLVCDAYMLELWGYAFPADAWSWALRWCVYGLDLWLKDGRRPNPLGTGGGLRVSLALSER